MARSNQVLVRLNDEDYDRLTVISIDHGESLSLRVQNLIRAHWDFYYPSNVSPAEVLERLTKHGDPRRYVKTRGGKKVRVDKFYARHPKPEIVYG